ncbi:hypothetical protein [Mycoplasma sp. 48589B]
MEENTKNVELECSACGAQVSKTQRKCNYCSQPNKFYQSPASLGSSSANRHRPTIDFTSTNNYIPTPVQNTQTAASVQVGDGKWISWGLFILLFILFPPIGLIYLIICAAKK